jgi:hypothetical protein
MGPGDEAAFEARVYVDGVHMRQEHIRHCFNHCLHFYSSRFLHSETPWPEVIG